MQQQQGDVCIEKVKKLPRKAKKLNHLVLAEGETTGHKHEVIGDAVLYREEKGDLYLEVKDGRVELVHEEHGKQTIEEGLYRISQVREWDYESEEAKRVID